MSRTVVRLLAESLRSRNLCIAASALGLLVALHGTKARAGVYTDDLSRCLVKSSDSNDRVMLVQWMFTAFALHPAVQPLASITAEQRSSATKKVATLFVRLLTENCRKEAVDAMKYEGEAAIDTSFQVLGGVASRDLMTDPQVSKGMGALGDDLSNEEKLKALLKDAGITEKPSTPPSTK
jgi:hypothetical protein